MVTISRQAGSGGDEIARLLAQELGWRVLDNAVVERLLVERGLPRVRVEAYNERKPDLWHRLSAERHTYLQLLKLVSYEFARGGDCIILGRGGQLMFAELPGVLRVRVVAPLRDRITRVCALEGGDEHRAQQVLHQTDSERDGFYKSLFHADWNSHDLYDLVIDTHLISPKTAADLIRRALVCAESKEQRSAASRKLEHLYFAQKAVVAILFEEKLPIHGLQIVVNNGMVRLEGSAQDHPSMERAQELAASLFEEKKIENDICFGPRFAEIMAGIHRGAGGGHSA